MELWNDIQLVLRGIPEGSVAPWVIALSLVLATFLLEDLAIALGAALAAHGSITWLTAFGAVAGGIALGDLGLYALGLSARRVPWLHRRYIANQTSTVKPHLDSKVIRVVFLARVIPGLRLVTYTLCGFVRVRLLQFSIAIVLATTVWTGGLFWLSSALGATLSEYWHISAPVAVGLPIICFALAVPAWRWMRSAAKRKKL